MEYIGMYWNISNYDIEICSFKNERETKTQNQSKPSIIFIDTLWWPQFSWISREDGCGSGAGTRGASQFFLGMRHGRFSLVFCQCFFLKAFFLQQKQQSTVLFWHITGGDECIMSGRELLMAEPWRLRALRLRWRSPWKGWKMVGGEFGDLVGWFVST